MTEPIFYVWLWVDPATNQPRYVGYGAKRGDQFPWDIEWERRGGSSPVSQWLATLDCEPLRDPTVPIGPYFRFDAARQAARVRKGLNAELLANRSYNGTQCGGGKSKPVVDPDGDMFPSLRAAARDRGVDVGTVVNWLKHPTKSGWHYLDANYQAQRTSPTNCCSLCHAHTRKEGELLAGPAWSSGAICKRCRKVIARLEKNNQLSPDALRALANELYAGVSERKKQRYTVLATAGLPCWLGIVADLMERAAEC